MSANLLTPNHRLRLSLPLMIHMVVAMFISPLAMAADLSDADKATVAQIQSLMSRTEQSLKFATDTAGPGDGNLTGTKAKLTAIRLEPAASAMPVIQEKLKTLPADNADVMALQKRADANSAAVTALQTRITGKAPVPVDPGKKTVKLDYKQVDALKDAQSVLREIEGQSRAIEKVAVQVKETQDKTTINHRLIVTAMNSIAFVRQRDKYMAGHMGKLPADGTGVEPVSDAWKAAIASTDASEKILSPVHEQLSKLVDPASYPKFDEDMKRLSELTRQYANADQFLSNREQAGLAFEQMTAARDEMARVVKTYAILMLQKTERGKSLTNQEAYFNEKQAAFNTAAQEQIKTLPAEIRKHINDVTTMAAQAVKEEKPAYFTGGIEQTMGFAQEKQTLLAKLSPEAGKATQSELDATRAQLKEQQKSLSAAIIAANELPPDRYAADDRAKLIELAIATWKKQQPDAVIMASRIPGEKWSRNTVWRFENRSWYLVDLSKLQVQLIVKHENNLAAIRPINLYINHQEGDRLSAGAMDSIKDELTPQRFLQQSKVK